MKFTTIEAKSLSVDYSSRSLFFESEYRLKAVTATQNWTNTAMYAIQLKRCTHRYAYSHRTQLTAHLLPRRPSSAAAAFAAAAFVFAPPTVGHTTRMVPLT